MPCAMASYNQTPSGRLKPGPDSVLGASGCKEQPACAPRHTQAVCCCKNKLSKYLFTASPELRRCNTLVFFFTLIIAVFLYGLRRVRSYGGRLIFKNLNNIRCVFGTTVTNRNVRHVVLSEKKTQGFFRILSGDMFLFAFGRLVFHEEMLKQDAAVDIFNTNREHNAHI